QRRPRRRYSDVYSYYQWYHQFRANFWHQLPYSGNVGNRHNNRQEICHHFYLCRWDVMAGNSTHGSTIGRCHICWADTEIAYCTLCRHWFCATCRGKWTQRMFAAIKQMAIKQAPCCGPSTSEVTSPPGN